MVFSGSCAISELSTRTLIFGRRRWIACSYRAVGSMQDCPNMCHIGKRRAARRRSLPILMGLRSGRAAQPIACAFRWIIAPQSRRGRSMLQSLQARDAAQRVIFQIRRRVGSVHPVAFEILLDRLHCLNVWETRSVGRQPCGGGGRQRGAGDLDPLEFPRRPENPHFLQLVARKPWPVRTWRQTLNPSEDRHLRLVSQIGETARPHFRNFGMR